MREDAEGLGPVWTGQGPNTCLKLGTRWSSGLGMEASAAPGPEWRIGAGRAPRPSCVLLPQAFVPQVPDGPHSTSGCEDAEVTSVVSENFASREARRPPSCDGCVCLRRWRCGCSRRVQLILGAVLCSAGRGTVREQ